MEHYSDHKECSSSDLEFVAATTVVTLESGRRTWAVGRWESHDGPCCEKFKSFEKYSKISSQRIRKSCGGAIAEILI
jgi:hypothetical protein